MRAQVTSEYLLITLIAVAMVVASAGFLVKIKANADATYELAVFKDSVDTVYSDAEELCVLGNGNSRSVSIESTISVVRDEESGFVIFMLKNAPNNERIVKEFTCELADDYEGVTGKTAIINNHGKIEMAN